jgi:DNA-binding SARP family transcriptional activator
MQARILGPFLLEEGGRRIPISGIRQRAVLVSLVLHANEVVPSEQLLVDLWGEDTPRSAANSLQAAISRLRRALPEGRLVTRAPGYALRIFPEELDVSQFEQLVSEGREALTAGAAEQAARTLRQALSLWQGPALADFRYEPFAQAEIVRLEELHLTCLEERIEADLALGSAGVLVAELRRLVDEHPVRERLRGQLMLALYRDGRQTEALDVYREFRDVLRDELGLDPSPQLQELETAILRHDALDSRPPTAEGPLARRPVTVVCVLLRVASDSGLALDPEAYEVVNEQSVAGLTAVLERYGGKLAVSANERLIGVFGAASVHEDDALRAARASLEARGLLSTETAAMLQRYGVSLACRVGVATGEALVGGSVPLGSAGSVGAQAVLLAEEAEPGQILISQQTQELAAAAIETESVAPGRFVLRSAEAAARPLALRLDGPLVGRDEEIRQLEAACAEASQEEVTTLVTVIGEAGLGKTRLVYEIARRLGHEVSVLTGRCLPYGEGITFWPLREVIRQASGGHDSPHQIEALLHGQPDAGEVAARLGLALGPGNQGRLDAAEIFWAARRLLETLAQSRPLVVVFEDLHWAESTFLDLVESLAVQHGRSPVVLVCVARPELLEQRPAWAAGTQRARVIELAPLAGGPAVALLDSLTEDQRLPPSTRAQLLETAAGNPLYLEQLAASLSEQAGSEGRPVLPPTIQALLGARLQRLGPGASSVLARAAIVGKDFGAQAVRELLPPEARGPLSRNLQTLVAKGLVEHDPSDRRPAEEYSFRHILIQEAAYRAIPKSLRAELHQRFADWLEHVFLPPDTERPEILGYHLEQSVRYLSELRPAEARLSPLARRAAAHLETAGRAADDRGDALAAVNLLSRAAGLLPQDDPALARLYTSLGAALTEAGELEKAMVTLGDAQRVAAANGDEGQRAHALAQALISDLNLAPDRAAKEIAHALPELSSQFARGPDELGLCRAMQLQAAMDWDQARSAAAEEAWQRAAQYARRVNDRRQLAEILGWLASAALWGPTPAAEGIRRCQDYLDEIGNHPRGQAAILLHMAGLYAMQDQAATAQATLDRAKSQLDTLGPTMAAAITEPAAFIAMLAGDPVTAEMHLRHEYESLSRMGEKRLLSTSAALLARALVAQGEKRYAEASQLVEVSQQAAGGEDLSDRIIGQGLSARILADRGRYGEARELASTAVALAAQTDLLSQHADAWLDLAHVLAASGRGAEARAAATQARDLYQRKGNLPGARESLGYLTYLGEELPMSHSWVPSVELNQDGTISLYLTVEGFDQGTPIEISGTATQTNGAVASFYSVQAVPAASSGQGAPMAVKSIPTVSKFVDSDPITVIARAAEVWITTLQPGAPDRTGSDTPQALWSSTSDGPALCPPGSTSGETPPSW